MTENEINSEEQPSGNNHEARWNYPNKIVQVPNIKRDVNLKEQFDPNDPNVIYRNPDDFSVGTGYSLGK